MSRSHWGGVFVTTISLMLAASGLSDAAHADKDQRNVAIPPEGETAAPPVVQVPAITGVDAAVDRLQQSQRLASLPIDWAGLKTFYAGGGQALWVTPSGYSALGSQLLFQAPKAVAAGMPVSADVLQALASLPPQSQPAVPADAEALMSALYVASAYDATKQVGNQETSSMALLTALSSAKEPTRVLAGEFPTFHMFWRLYAMLPTYEAYYQHGGWPTVS